MDTVRRGTAEALPDTPAFAFRDNLVVNLPASKLTTEHAGQVSGEGVTAGFVGARCRERRPLGCKLARGQVDNGGTEGSSEREVDRMYSATRPPPETTPRMAIHCLTEAPRPRPARRSSMSVPGTPGRTGDAIPRRLEGSSDMTQGFLPDTPVVNLPAGKWITSVSLQSPD